VVAEDLIGALDSGQLSYAALDALSPEPLPPEARSGGTQSHRVPHVARRPTVAQLVTEIAANIRSIARAAASAGSRHHDRVLEGGRYLDGAAAKRLPGSLSAASGAGERISTR